MSHTVRTKVRLDQGHVFVQIAGYLDQRDADLDWAKVASTGEFGATDSTFQLKSVAYAIGDGIEILFAMGNDPFANLALSGSGQIEFSSDGIEDIIGNLDLRIDRLHDAHYLVRPVHFLLTLEFQKQGN